MLEFTDKNHSLTYTTLKYHKCTPEDYKNFSAPLNQKHLIEEDFENQFFYCLDHTDMFGEKVELKLFGSGQHMESRTLSIIYRPCVPKQVTEENRGSGECVADLRNETAMDEFLKK
jgi:hypothetical protein